MSKQTTRILLAGLAGLAAGLTIGILFAPQKGSRTRKRLMKQFSGLTESLRERFPEEMDLLGKMFRKKEESEESEKSEKKAEEEENEE
jgi:gas vesicle protein